MLGVYTRVGRVRLSKTYRVLLLCLAGWRVGGGGEASLTVLAGRPLVPRMLGQHVTWQHMTSHDPVISHTTT